MAAILVLQVRLASLLAWMQTIELEAEGVVYLPDRQGQIAAHPALLPNGALREVSHRPAVQKALRGERGMAIAFDYAVSHDLRGPLTRINGLSQALLEDYAHTLEAQGQDYLQRIVAATQQMAELVDALLAVSHVSRAELSHDAIDLSALARTVAAELQGREPTRPVTLAIAEGLIAHGDARLLGSVLENLFSNAWKFTAGQPHARIEFGGKLGPNGSRVFFVRDNGVGFDMAYADKLFGAFQRLHRPTEFPGTGVGLATVQRIIQRHGGRIWAEAAVGHGAMFYFTL